MAKTYFISITDPEQFEQAVDHLARGLWFKETDMRKADDETIITNTKTAYDRALYYLAYKGINFSNFESP